jgi:hypothetical protein
MFSVDCSTMPGFDNRKPSGDWAIAMGLGLKRTAGKFAPRDGTPRSATPPAPQQPAPTAAAVPAAPAVISIPASQEAINA